MLAAKAAFPSFNDKHIESMVKERFVKGLDDDRVRDCLAKDWMKLEKGSLCALVEAAQSADQMFSRFRRNLTPTSEQTSDNDKRHSFPKASVPKSKMIYSVPPRIAGLCQIQNEIFNFELDTGADFSMISQENYLKINPTPNLKKTSLKFRSASEDDMGVSGEIQVVVKLGEEERSHILFVSTFLTGSILFGRDIIQKFEQLHKPIRELEQVIQAMSSRILCRVNAVTNELVKDLTVEELRYRAIELMGPVSAASMSDLRPLAAPSNKLTQLIQFD